MQALTDIRPPADADRLTAPTPNLILQMQAVTKTYPTGAVPFVALDHVTLAMLARLSPLRGDEHEFPAAAGSRRIPADQPVSPAHAPPIEPGLNRAAAPLL